MVESLPNPQPFHYKTLKSPSAATEAKRQTAIRHLAKLRTKAYLTGQGSWESIFDTKDEPGNTIR